MKSNTFSETIVLGGTVAFRFRKSLSRLAGRGTLDSPASLCAPSAVTPHSRAHAGRGSHATDSRPPLCRWGRFSGHGRRPSHRVQHRQSPGRLRGTSGTPARSKALGREDVTPDDLLHSSDRHRTAPAGPALRCHGDVVASGRGLRGSAEARASVHCPLRVRVCHPCSAASVPTAWRQKKRGRKGADVTSPTYDSAEEKAVASQMAVNAPSRSGEKHSGSIARKEACRPPRRAPERGRAACRLRLPCARPCGGAASRAQRRLPAGENNLCEAPGYVRAPPPPRPPKAAERLPQMGGAGTPRAGPRGIRAHAGRSRSGMCCLRRYSENLN